MGKKRISLLGDSSSEEEKRQQKTLKRQQKKLREGKKLSVAEQKALLQEKANKAATVNIDEDKQIFDPIGEMRAEMARMKAERDKTTIQEQQTPAEKKSTKKLRVHKSSRRYQSRKSQTDRKKPIPLSTAVEKILKLSYSRFTATIEFHVNLRKQDAFSSTQIELPHSAGKAKKAVALDSDTLAQIANKNIDFDVLFASPDQMKDLVPHAKFLGPRGLMPNPKTGTLVPNPQKAAQDYAGKATLNLKPENKFPILHTTVGRTDMKAEHITANLNKIINTIEPRNIESAYIAASMSPSLRIEIEA